MRLIGLDGCKNGAWVAARPGPTFAIVHDLMPLLLHAERGELRMVVDVPIGLDGAGRRCDADSRRLLKQRASSVFTPPSRTALNATSQPEASRLNIAVCGVGIGCQAFGILPRIAAVDRLMTPQLQSHVHEGHPEVSFALLAGKLMEHGKKSAEGEAERLTILERFGLDFDPATVRRQLGPSIVSRNDVIDAAVMLVTAMRIEHGQAIRLPHGAEQRDERGLLMEMWA